MTPDGDHKWNIEIFRDRLRHSLGARYLLRFHVSLILLFSILTGWAVDVLLLRLGAERMAWRYFAAVLSAYGAFYLGVYAWIEISGIREYVKLKRANLLVGDDVPRRPVEAEKPPDWDWSPGAELAGCLPGSEGCLTVVVVAMAAIGIFYFFGGYVIANALTFFADIVLELLLAAGLLRGINRYEASGWTMSVWRHTRWSLGFTLYAAIVIGWLAQAEYPQARKLPEVLKLWRL